jgi:NAD(P)-dependent dehydrogenase (short-subunit alcohol dehydrogenase family)
MNKKTVALFGGSGGLGSSLSKYLTDKYNVIAISSKLVDVTDKSQVNDFFAQNQIDVVINLSGYNYDGFVHKLNELDQSEIDKLIDVNINGNINILAGCLPHMRKNSFGRIILISSVLAEKIVPGTGLYSATKSFIDTLSNVVSAENISKGITCNTLRLGYFDGGMCHRIDPRFTDSIRNSIGLKRWGSIEELYKTVDYLIETEYMTGQNITVNGGLL